MRSDDSSARLSRRDVLKGTGAGIATTGLAGCIKGIGGGGSEAFTIGANLALSQGWKPYGQTMQRAAEIAIDEINEAGGLGGKDVELVVEDNKVDPKTVREKTNKLVQQDGADIIFGPISSASRNAMAPVLEQHEIPALYPVQYEGPAAKDYCNKWIFKVGEIPVQQVKPFVPWLMEEYGDSFYLLGSDYVWPQTMNDLITEEVEANGGTVVAEEYVSLGTTDFTSIIPRIESKDPDVLFMELTGASVPAIQKQMANRGVRDQWKEVGLAHGQGLLAGAPLEAVEGLLSCHAYMENLQNSANQQFMEKFHSEYGEDALVDYLTGPAYTAIKLLEQGVKNAGGTSTEDLMSGLPGSSVDSVMGTTALEVDHQISVGCTVGEVNQNKQYDPVTGFDLVKPEDVCEEF